VCDVSLDELLVRSALVDEVEADVGDLRLATRCAVTEGRADICMGGSAAGFGFFASVDDSV
jgi:hypothetical protein